MAEGEFYRAEDLQEALYLLAQHGKRASILAGGTDLMVRLNRRQESPEVLIYIGGCGLSYIKEENRALVIGAATSFTDIVRSQLLQDKAPLLVQASATIGSTAIRNMGTIGGNLANASPAADSAVALLALGGSIKLLSVAEERVVDASAFFTGPGRTVRRKDELLQEVIVPIQKPGVKAGFRRMGKRRADFIAIASVAVALAMENGQCEAARIAMGSVAPTPLLSKRGAAMLVGRTLDDHLIADVARAVARETSPIDDVRGKASFRRRAITAMVKEVLGQMKG